jgi:hypothetical protein
MQASHINGVGGVLERFADSFVGDGTALGPRFAWRMSIRPTHLVTNGRPRAYLESMPLELRKWYRFEWSFRLHQHSAFGWGDYGSSIRDPILGIAGIAQDASGYDVNQNTNGGPFQLLMRGSRVYPMVRTIDPELGALQPDGFWNWGDSDRVFYGSGFPYRVPLGYYYNDVAIDIYLDERSTRDGGTGRIRGWWNRQPWFEHRGPTVYPRGRTSGQVGAVSAWFGMYEVSGAPLADGSLCSAVPQTSIERSINFHGIRVLRGV